jgi:ABC-type branched-subunit amino acid transport system substrate-binding protein
MGDAVAAARWLVADGNAQVLLSALPDDETARVSATADGLRIPLLNLTATRDALRGSGCHRSAFHVAPSRAMQCDAVAAWLAGTRNAKRVRMLTDAGDEGRAIAGRLARALRAHGVEVAGSTSIDKTGPGKPDVVTGPGDARPDALVFALSQTERASLLDAWRTAATNPPLVEIPMGASPDAPSPVEIFQPAAWHASLDRFGADQLNQRFQARGGRQMDDAAWAGWAAVKIAWEAAARGRADDGPGIAAYLERDTAQMDGQKGWPLSFRAWDHQLRQPMYIVSRSPAAPAGRVSGELPAGERGPSASSVSQLDALGDTAASTECRWGAA